MDSRGTVKPGYLMTRRPGWPLERIAESAGPTAPKILRPLVIAWNASKESQLNGAEQHPRQNRKEH